MNFDHITLERKILRGNQRNLNSVTSIADGSLFVTLILHTSSISSEQLDHPKCSSAFLKSFKFLFFMQTCREETDSPAKASH